MRKLVVLLMAFLGFSAIAVAQEAVTVTLTASPASGNGSVTPTLNWSSTGAVNCTASGGWSGTKATSGSQVLPAITSTTTYNLSCAAAGGSATLTWTAPTQNTDGSPLTDLAGFKAYYGTSATAMNTVVNISDPAARTHVISGLSAATWYFSMTAYNVPGLESVKSGTVNKVVAVPTGSASATVSVVKVPGPPVLTAVTGTTAFELKMLGNGDIRLGRDIGTIKYDVECGEYEWVAGGYYVVPLDAVDVARAPKSSIVVASCTPYTG